LLRSPTESSPDARTRHLNSVDAIRQAAKWLADLANHRPTQPGIHWQAEYRAAQRFLEQAQRDFTAEGRTVATHRRSERFAPEGAGAR
jgi:hypothetical protein